MIAPLELSRNAKMVSSANAAAMTQQEADDRREQDRIRGHAAARQPHQRAGASLRAASTNSMRDAVYMPEFRQLAPPSAPPRS